ncbi:Major surface-labeled trophozoite antigen precursor, partial [Giardia duodenalis]
VCDPNVRGKYCNIASAACAPGETFIAGTCVPDACVSSLSFLAICGGHGACSRIQNEFKCVCEAEHVVLSTMNQEKLYCCIPKACNVSGVYCPYGECAISISGVSHPIYIMDARIHLLSQSESSAAHNFQCVCRELYTGAVYSVAQQPVE